MRGNRGSTTIAPIALPSLITKDVAEVEANANSKGAERFPRPLHSLRSLLSAHHSFLMDFSLSLAPVLVWCWFFTSGGHPRHDDVVSETACAAFLFFSNTHLSSAGTHWRLAFSARTHLISSV
jgi:hypothetical protein